MDGAMSADVTASIANDAAGCLPAQQLLSMISTPRRLRPATA